MLLRPRRAFTLIELLVVIAIIAILAVVVVLTLNPAQLLAQSRDANRVSDLATLNSAIGLYQTDVPSGNMGTSSVIYTSLPDASSTCGTQGLLTLPSGYTYHCASPTTYRTTNGTGWIPLDFQNISSGSPFGSLPTDPTNQSSSGLYYTYTTNGSQYQILAPMESQKYKGTINGPLGNGVDIQGSYQVSGPVGYWPLDEGSGTIAYDRSGNGNNGTWQGTAAYAPGSVESSAASFNGSNYIEIPNPQNGILDSPNMTVVAWIDPLTISGSSHTGIIAKGNAGPEDYLFGLWPGGDLKLSYNDGSWHDFQSGIVPALATWQQVAWVVHAGSGVDFYVNGFYKQTISGSIALPTTSYPLWLGTTAPNSADAKFNGLMNDVRIYDRVLSPREIQTLYYAGK
jgi:prepilin-type N-terminal cleavage/methylation domain-containing protein